MKQQQGVPAQERLPPRLDVVSADALLVTGALHGALEHTPEDGAEGFLESLDYDRQRNDYEIDIREIINNISINGNPHLERVAGRTADQIIDLDTEVIVGDIIPARLNDDELDDVIVFTEHNDDHIKGILLLSN